MLRLILGLLILLPAACAPFKPPPVGPEALIVFEAGQVGALEDDLDPASLKRAIDQSLRYLNRLPADKRFVCGPNAVTASGLAASLKEAARLLEMHGLNPVFYESLAAEYRFFGPRGEVLFTGYYEPLLEGRLQPEGRFTCPLLRPPEDLVTINLKDFGLEPKILRGRLADKRVVPYHTRAEIDQGALKDEGLEIVWVDPVEAFFLHIQGSGRIHLPDGRDLLVNYAEQNGRPYVSLGRVMIDRGLLLKEEVSLQSLKQYLYAHPAETAELLAANPSYVFFRVLEEGPLGCFEVPLTPHRSLALDRRVYPPAALALIQTRGPLIEEGRISSWRPFSRLVLIQDTGGAIRGPERADLFFGPGQEAELGAGSMKEKGRLFVLVLKSVIE